MNLDQLKATIEANKKGIAIAGAAGVGGLALLNRKKKANAGTDAAGAGYGLTNQPSTGAAGAYDSTSSDVYNAIQPQLESLGQLLAQLQNRQNTTPTPVPAPPPTAGPAPTPTQAPTPAPVPFTPGTPGRDGVPLDAGMTSTSGYWVPTTRNGQPDGGLIPAGGWTAPAGRPAVGSSLLNSAGQVIGTLTGYTFNGAAQHSFIDGVSMDDAYNATKNPTYR